MTYRVGWVMVSGRPSRAVGWGGRFSRASDLADRPTGPAHMVEDGADSALCGAAVAVPHPDREWPPVIGVRCQQCADLAG